MRILLAFLFLPGLLTCCAPPQPGEPPNIGEFAWQHQFERPFEPRLSGGFGYSPCPAATVSPVPRCATPPAPGTAAFETLTAAQRQLREQPASEASARWLHGRAVANLLRLPGLDDPIHRDAFERILEDFEQAVALKPENPDFANDLAAALILRAGQQQRPQDLVRALDHLASGTSRHSPEALFNRALILDMLHLPTEAMASWHHVERLEPLSPWASEARTRAARRRKIPEASEEALLEPDENQLDTLLPMHRHALRQQLEDTLLPRWATLLSTGQYHQATQLGSRIHRLARALSRLSGDQLLLEATQDLDLPGVDHTTRARAHLLYHDGLEAYRRFTITEAEKLLREARDAFEAVRSPYSDWASYHLAACAYQSFQYAEAQRLLRNLRQASDPAHYPLLHGRSLRLTALIHAIKGDHSQALLSYRRSLALLEDTTEARELVPVQTGLAGTLAILEGPELGWLHYHRALALAADLGDPLHTYRATSRAAELALETGHPAAAEHLLAESLRAAQTSANPVAVVGVYRRRALLFGRLKRLEEARSSLVAARQELHRIANSDIRRAMAGDLALVEGEIAPVVHPHEALEHWTRALQIHGDTEFYSHIILAWLGRARAHRARGDFGAAARDFSAGLSEVERQRSRIEAGLHRAIFLRAAHNLFDEMIALQVDHLNNPERGLEYAEAAQARVLLDWVSSLDKGARDPLVTPPTVTPSTVDEISEGLPASAVLVMIHRLPERLLVWVLTSEGFPQDRTVTQIDLRNFPLDVWLPQYLRMLRRHPADEEAREMSARLYELLLGPINDLLPAGAHLLLVADDSLSALPWGTLWDETTGQYLIEQHTLTLSPGASVALSFAAARDRNKGHAEGHTPSQPDSVLAVGDPAFDPQLSPLHRLPAAREEARDIAALYSGSHLLTAEDATTARFLAFAPRANLVHYAGHALINSHEPLLSRLLLAPSVGDSGLLYLRDILAHRFGSTRLVVLSACSTATLTSESPIGPTSFARTFLAAGVPVVVASLWDVGDQESRMFFTRFHEILSKELSVSDALRRTQLEFLYSGERSSAWAAFQVYGADFLPLSRRNN